MQVFDWDRGTKDDKLGSASVDLRGLRRARRAASGPFLALFLFRVRQLRDAVDYQYKGVAVGERNVLVEFFGGKGPARAAVAAFCKFLVRGAVVARLYCSTVGVADDDGDAGHGC